jgi:hypothetical protein
MEKTCYIYLEQTNGHESFLEKYDPDTGEVKWGYTAPLLFPEKDAKRIIHSIIHQKSIPFDGLGLPYMGQLRERD